VCFVLCDSANETLAQRSLGLLPNATTAASPLEKNALLMQEKMQQKEQFDALQATIRKQALLLKNIEAERDELRGALQKHQSQLIPAVDRHNTKLPQLDPSTGEPIVSTPRENSTKEFVSPGAILSQSQILDMVTILLHCILFCSLMCYLT